MSLSPAQLAMRRTGIGSSDIGALVGVDKYKNAIGVYLDKVLPIEEEQQAPTGRNPRRWGQRLQPLIVQEWAEIHGFHSIQFEETIGTRRHPKVAIALASPDAWALVDGVPARICEAKAPGLREADDWDEEEAPEGYIVQTMWQQGVTGVHAGDICALLGGQDFRVRPVEFIPDMFEGLVEIAERFWTDHVVPQKPPPLDHTDAAAEYLRRRYGLHPKAGLLELDPSGQPFMEAWALAEQIRWSTAQIKKLKEEDEASRHKLKELCGDSEGIAGICTSKHVQRAGYSVDPVEYRELRLARQKKARK